jgi:hypothetical protein
VKCKIAKVRAKGIIHTHLHLDYNPLQGMLVLISSLKFSTVPYAAGAES